MDSGVYDKKTRKRRKESSTRLSALEQLKKARESGHIARDLSVEVEPVYDLVDDAEYEKICRERLDCDFIEGDEGDYIDGGREICDDEYCEDMEKNYTFKPEKSKKRKKFIQKPSESNASDIRSMLSRTSAKVVKLVQDDLLNELMNDIGGSIVPEPIQVSKEIKAEVSDCKTFKEDNFNDDQVVSSQKSSSENNKNDVWNSRLPFSQMSDSMDDLAMLHQYDTIVSASLDKSDSFPSATGIESVSLQSTGNSFDIFFSSELLFYWLDCYEDSLHSKGVLYLFGKIKRPDCEDFCSMCLLVKDLNRQIFLLPRKKNRRTEEDVTMRDVYTEFNEITDKYKILRHKCRPVTMKNCFCEDSDMEEEMEYFEAQYSAEFPPLPNNLTGDTFSKVFGTMSSLTEIFLLNKRIRGPCWLSIAKRHPVQVWKSWCQVEACASESEISVLQDQLPPPKLTILSLSFGIIPSTKFRHQSEVVVAVGLIGHNFPLNENPTEPLYQSQFSVVTKPDDGAFPYDFRAYATKQKALSLITLPTERALCCYVLNKIHLIDPDIITGHDLSRVGLEVFLNRIENVKAPYWSKIGRLKRSLFPKFAIHGSSRHLTCGRLLMDVSVSARELLTKCRSFDLPELCLQVLGIQKQFASPEEIRQAFGFSDLLIEAVTSVMDQAICALKIATVLNALPLAYQITVLCGNTLARTLIGGRAERNEFLLLHAFHISNYIPPDPPAAKQSKQINNTDDDADILFSKDRKKASYAGGLVLEPKIGFYDHFVLLLDFNSLYPSIIQEYNICFSTVKHPQNDTDEIDPPLNSTVKGILPAEIQKLVESRRDIRKMMKSESISTDLYNQYNIRQLALKLTANSMYGCLGFQHSRFYSKHIAALITRLGREILTKTKNLVESLNVEVIYGDTDSIMINSCLNDINEVTKLGNKIKNEINRHYKLLEIEIDGVFQTMLLLKKKKYAGLIVEHVNPDGTFSTSRQIKGLDIVRRDWCDLAKEFGEYAIDQILSGASSDDVLERIHSALSEVAEQVRHGQIDNKKFVIDKQLTKNVNLYPDYKSLPHVQVAMRLSETGKKKVKPGDIISYVICKDGSTLPFVQRAYSYEEFSADKNLSLDVDYYLSHQLHPVISRLLEPFDGTDAAKIAEYLGLDASKYKTKAIATDTLEASFHCIDADRFTNCEPLTFHCPSCSHTSTWDAPFVLNKDGVDVKCILSFCQNKDCNTKPADCIGHIKNTLSIAIRKHISLHYQAWQHCEDVTCAYRTKQVSSRLFRDKPMCPMCERSALIVEYPASELYDQLCFYESIFNSDKFKQRNAFSVPLKSYVNAESEYRSQLVSLSSFVSKKFINRSAYGFVDLAEVFAGL